MSGLLGWASGVPFGGLSKAIVVGAFLNIVHAIATALAWDWWRKVMASKEMPATWWLLFFAWLAAPLAFLHHRSSNRTNQPQSGWVAVNS